MVDRPPTCSETSCVLPHGKRHKRCGIHQSMHEHAYEKVIKSDKWICARPIPTEDGKYELCYRVERDGKPPPTNTRSDIKCKACKRDKHLWNQYVLVRQLGKGATATVFLAFNENSPQRRKLHAIKIPHWEHKNRLVGEFSKLMDPEKPSFDHLHYTVDGSEESIQVITMPYVPGLCLRGLIIEYPELLESDSFRLQLFRTALVELQRTYFKRKRNHGDIKPANMKIFFKEGRLCIRYIDLGNASYLLGVDKDIRIKGTPGFARPKSHLYEAFTEAFDLFSLGKVLWCLIKQSEGPHCWSWECGALSKALEEVEYSGSWFYTTFHFEQELKSHPEWLAALTYGMMPQEHDKVSTLELCIELVDEVLKALEAGKEYRGDPYAVLGIKRPRTNASSFAPATGFASADLETIHPRNIGDIHVPSDKRPTISRIMISTAKTAGTAGILSDPVMISDDRKREEKPFQSSWGRWTLACCLGLVLYLVFLDSNQAHVRMAWSMTKKMLEKIDSFWRKTEPRDPLSPTPLPPSIKPEDRTKRERKTRKRSRRSTRRNRRWARRAAPRSNKRKTTPTPTPTPELIDKKSDRFVRP